MAGATSACSTAKGFGRDVEKTGDKIQDAASH
ncbi:MAG: entericidin A/B family lipoprotein [Luteolibacter sp.]